jgi:hypothetical protein
VIVIFRFLSILSLTSFTHLSSLFFFLFSLLQSLILQSDINEAIQAINYLQSVLQIHQNHTQTLVDLLSKHHTALPLPPLPVPPVLNSIKLNVASAPVISENEKDTHDRRRRILKRASGFFFFFK